MKIKKILFVIYILICFNYSQAQTTVGLLQHDNGTLNSGYVLFSPLSSTTTYLIDMCGKQVKSWASNYRPGQSCYLLSNGTLLRAGNTNNSTFNAGGKGGIIQKIDWNGNITWSYNISSNTECQHHDILALPNGNVLALVWEIKTKAEAVAQGRNPALTADTVWSEKIIEIQPTGSIGGNIVWQWDVWNHLIQDFDSTKANYGVVADNPQLININYTANANNSDWIHLNSIDYNPALDQILVSAHNFSEIWVIDHSTTTAQAASHSGGNSGKGGDILYRWGNPAAYDNGTINDQKLFGQHNAHWIESGLPYQNQIIIFNNGNGRPGGNYSTVEIINPPDSGANYAVTLPYLPSNPSWIYNNGNPNNFYAQNISGAQELSNGNVLICSGPQGTFFEIDSTGNTLWKYINPVKMGGIINQGSAPTQNPVFRCTFYSDSFAGFYAHTLTAGNTIEDSNSISDACSLTLGITEKYLSDVFQIYPNPAKKYIFIRLGNTKSKKVSYHLLSLTGKTIMQGSFTGVAHLDLGNIQSGCYIIKIVAKERVLTKKIIILK